MSRRETPLGPLELLDGDVVSETLAAGGHWDDHVFQALRPHCGRGLVIDVGANVGALALRFAELAIGVVAFEPNPQLAVKLVANAPPNVAVYCYGVYSSKVKLAPRRQEGNSVSSWPWLPAEYGVLAQPYDTPGPVTAIKIDAQGADLHAMLGLATIIERDHPAIAFEFEEAYAKEHGHIWEDYLLTLDSWGYTLTQLEGGVSDWLALAAPSS